MITFPKYPQIKVYILPNGHYDITSLLEARRCLEENTKLEVVNEIYTEADRKATREEIALGVACNSQVRTVCLAEVFREHEIFTFTPLPEEKPVQA